MRLSVLAYAAKPLARIGRINFATSSVVEQQSMLRSTR
jgi:hypothetical protein